MTAAALRVFRIDVRLLAAFRMALAVLVLVDVIRRAPLATVLLTAEGLMPSTQLGGVLTLLRSPSGQLGGVIIAVLAVLALLIGYRSQLAAVITLLALTAVHQLNPWILDSGDVVLRLLLLWAALLPIGSVWAVDARRRPSEAGEFVVSFAAVGVLLVIPSVYLLSVVQKLTGSAWAGGAAVADALAGSLWTRPLGHWLAGHAEVSTMLTYAVLIIEVVAPLLLLSPWRTQRSRLVGVSLLVALQVGIGSVLRMGLFPWVMTTGLIPFLPAVRSGAASAGDRRRPTSRRLQLAGAVALMLMVAWNVRGPRWTMYSPDPYALDFGVEVQVEVSSGEWVPLDDGRGGARFEPLDRLWSDYRGGIYMEQLTNPEMLAMRRAFADWVRRAWEAQDPARRAVWQIRLQFVEWPPGRPADALVTPLPLQSGVVS